MIWLMVYLQHFVCNHISYYCVVHSINSINQSIKAIPGRHDTVFHTRFVLVDPETHTYWGRQHLIKLLKFHLLMCHHLRKEALIADISSTHVSSFEEGGIDCWHFIYSCVIIWGRRHWLLTFHLLMCHHLRKEALIADISSTHVSSFCYFTFKKWAEQEGPRL